MAIKLRDYQIETCKKLGKAIDEGKKRVLLCSPVGSGKTVMFTDFAKRIANVGLKTLIIVDRIELLKQTTRFGDEINPFGSFTANNFLSNSFILSLSIGKPCISAKNFKYASLA